MCFGDSAGPSAVNPHDDEYTKVFHGHSVQEQPSNWLIDVQSKNVIHGPQYWTPRN